MKETTKAVGRSKTYAVIDIGTLKVKFLIASLHHDSSLDKRYTSNTLTCFGCDMINDKVREDYLERTIVELNRCKDKLAEFNVTECRVVSTHAMRRAVNRSYVMGRMFNETGFVVENISSQDEANLFFNAALRDFPIGKRYALVDVGGGSIQVIVGRRGQHPEQTHLLPIGSATLHEIFTKNPQDENSFNTHGDIERMKDYILEQLVGVGTAKNVPLIYGSSNVIDLMRSIGLRLDPHDDSSSHPYKTYASSLKRFVDEVLPLTFAERENLYQFQKGYMWGIDKAFLNIGILAERLGSPYIIPSNSNVAEGLLYSMVK
jgi:exopolyphosphatase/guanosine-5'-triphosphate,3'-diphosphate pyrophosphatase